MSRKRCFLCLGAVSLASFVLMVYHVSLWRSPLPSFPNLLYQMWRPDVLQKPPYFRCSSLLQRAGSEPDLSLTFTDHTSFTSYPASHAPQVNGHFLSEQELDCLEEATEVKDVASADKSKVTVFGGSSRFTMGSEVKVRVDVYTHGGEQKQQGGDTVRVWLRDRNNQASAAGYVVDLLNGSYVGVLRALWVGQPEVVVALATPLEQIKLMYRLYATRGTLREIGWKFVNDRNQSAVTWCFPFDPSTLTPLQDKASCDLTAENYGSPWFCQKPANFSCRDQRGLHKMEVFEPLPLSDFERSLLSSFHKHFKQELTITVTSDTGESVVRATTPCHQRPWAATFLDSTPVGFFFRGTWHLHHCDVTARTPLQAYSPCLQNKTLYLFGDSTMRRLLDHVTSALGLSERPLVDLNAKTADKPAWNFSVHYFSHGLPFYGAETQTVPLSFRLDHDIPRDANGLVFITVFQHFTSLHPRAFRVRVKAIVQAVGRLVQRAPHVQVAVRGSHAYHHGNWDHAIAHDDYWGKLYDRIWKEELFPWRDHVVFLDTWDMTVGGENSDSHPPAPFLDALVQSLLAYTCHV